MSLFRQLLITNSQKKKRPYYCEVEYLETTGTQYINTGVSFHFSEDTVTLNAELTQLNTYQTVYGVNETFDGTIQFFGVRQLSSQEKWQGLGVLISFPTFTLNKQFTLQISRIDETFFQYKGETAVTGSINNLIDTTLNGYIFATNNNRNTAFYSIGKIYAFKQKRTGKLIRDLIPVLDWDMKPCMYDKVSGELFYNVGTGEFLYGREIHQVEYLESTGTQYIDTGVYFNDTTHTYGWEVEAQAVNTGYNSYKWFTGYNQNGVNSCGGYGDNATQYTFYPAGKYYQNGVSISLPSGGEKYERVKNVISLKNKICDNSIVLFARWVQTSNTIDAGGTKRIFNARYYDNDILVRDYIPAVDENGIGFMFDRVSHTIFDNAGTGAFCYPPVELEYLESSGTQYIDTGYSLNTNTDELYIDYTNTSEQNYKWMFGEYETNKNFGVTSQNITNPRFVYQGLISATKEEQYYTRHTLIVNSNGLFNDGIQKSSFKSFESSWNIYLFALNNTGTSVNGYFGYGKIYSYTHKRNGILLIDLIPALKDGQVGMWDKVNNTLYTNAGTGSFVIGRIIESEVTDVN